MQHFLAPPDQPARISVTHRFRLATKPSRYVVKQAPPNLGMLALSIMVIALACPWTQGACYDPISRVVRGNDAMAFRLYGQLAQTDGNLVFSPFGISLALSMTAAGAEGNTLQEMRQVLAIQQANADHHAAFSFLYEQIGQSAQTNGISLRIRNALWIADTLHVQPPFRSVVEQAYRASLFPMDFAQGAAVAQQINAWANEATSGRLTRMVDADQFSRDTRLLLLNTVFFKGTWTHRFSRSNTRPVPFHITPTRSVPVPMMHQTMMAGYVAESKVSVLELPYARGGFSMVLLLPTRKDGLGNLEASLAVEQVEALLQSLARIEVDVRMPRFAFHSDLPLNTILGTMGMKDAFIGGAADFSRISPDRRLHVSAVRHSAGIEVDEAGTTAWAGTTVQMNEGSPPPLPVFLADHPFLFFILEKSSGTILFMGRVAVP